MTLPRLMAPPQITMAWMYNILKMDILPKLLYLFQALPITLLISFYRTLRSLAIKFIWHHHPRRLKHKVLCSHKYTGGLGLPDFEIYHDSTIISRLLEWFPCPLTKQTVEQNMAQVDLRALLWGYHLKHRSIPTLSPLTKAALLLWHR